MKIVETLAMAALAALLIVIPPAKAQLSVDVTGEIDSDLRIAIPAMPSQKNADTPAGSTDVLGRQIAEVIASD
ncbi:MAG: Tol-Pal system protein TolB, partial [Alphaproteobacteria bacterium]|nr:Tol-Pal system protein TolB [Alphaproteobacteria bacterium]